VKKTAEDRYERKQQKRRRNRKKKERFQGGIYLRRIDSRGGSGYLAYNSQSLTDGEK
jgi:hypothetical protein